MIDRCPSKTWTLRMSAPSSSECVAYAWRSRCGSTRLFRPARRAALRNASPIATQTERYRVIAPGEQVQALRAPAFPIFPEHLQRARGQRHDTVVAILRRPHPHNHAAAVDVRRPEVADLRNAQARPVHQHEDGAMSQRRGTLDESLNLTAAQDIRSGERGGNPTQAVHHVGSAKGRAVKKPQSGQRYVHARRAFSATTEAWPLARPRANRRGGRRAMARNYGDPPPSTNVPGCSGARSAPRGARSGPAAQRLGSMSVIGG